MELTPLEYCLLDDLARHADRVRTHADFLPRAWGPGPPRPHRRHKLGDDAEDPTWIFNIPRVGYRMPGPDGGVAGK